LTSDHPVTTQPIDPAPTASGGLPPGAIRFADASLEFARSFDGWLRQFGGRRGLGGQARLGLQATIADIDRVSSAMRQPASIGIYGESQCGKSNLVSRFGLALGARSTSDGSLLVRDPGVDPSLAAWAREGTSGIEFAQWLNPINNDESTGIICRFTGHGPEPARSGCFVTRLLSHADLACSIALGHDRTVVDRAPEVPLREAVDRLRLSPMEPDRDGLCAHLLLAWQDLFRAWGGDWRPAPRLTALREAGWPDFLQACFDRGERPRWSPRDGGGPFVRLASQLWSGQKHLTELYATLLESLQGLEHASEVSVPAEAVCRSPDGSLSSLLDVNHLDRVFGPHHGVAGVRVDFRSRAGGPRTVRMPHATIAALVRELVLPLEAEDPSRPLSVDVLDFPGARALARQHDLEGHDEPYKVALDVFRRGKLTRLFSAGVQLQDCTALCLAVSGNGTLEAGPVVTEAIEEWLSREGWPQESGRAMADPPLVVAVTKSDMLLKTGNSKVFGDRLREIDRRYGGQHSWMRNWCDGPFQRVHWVHNPNARGRQPLPGKDDDGLLRDLHSYRADPDVCAHLPARADELFKAILEPPRDVDLLFESLREALAGARRNERLLARVMDHASRVAAEAQQLYLGKDEGRRVAQERAAAAADVAYLREGCARGRNSVSVFLKCLRIQAGDVQRACREAFKKAGAEDPHAVGVAKFESVYHQLYLGYCMRLERGMQELESDRGPHEERLASLEARFRMMPTQDWFRDRVHSSQVRQRFLSRNPDQLVNDPVLAAYVTTAWNRGTVWLDREPAATELPRLPPRRREHHASSERILLHWDERLPEVYRQMVDPNRASEQGNPELGTLRARFREVVGAVADGVDPIDRAADSASGPRARMSSLLEALEA
jgi:hypothetical protein